MGKKRVVLAGGGHVHLAVLETLAREASPLADVVLVSDGPSLIYSGMLPGHVAGHYPRGALEIALAPLAARAGATFLQNRIVGLDAGGRTLMLASGAVMPFDLLSLAVGSGINVSQLSSLGQKILPVRPIPDFLARWQGIREHRPAGGLRLGFAGGGAGGVELALATAHALPEAAIWLFTGQSGLLAGHPPSLRRRAMQHLLARRIAIIRGIAMAEPAGFRLADGQVIALDHVIAATGAAPPSWLSGSGLRLDPDGFAAVDKCFRCQSHPDILASGDVAAFPDDRVTRSGLHAVRAGPIIAHNLLAMLSGNQPRAHRPWKPPLYLLATKPGHALASGRRWSIEGDWLWTLKDRIDRAYVARHTHV